MSDVHQHHSHDESLKDSTIKLIHDIESSADFRGCLSPSAVRDLLLCEETSIEDLMVALLPNAARRAFVPITDYRVGAICLSKNGSLYYGCNIEIPNQVCGFAVHAEQTALANAYGHGDREVKALAITAPSCGHCRQFMAEFSSSMDLTIIIKGTYETTLANLLPDFFGPQHLDNPEGIANQPAVMLKLTSDSKPSNKELAARALKAAEVSYAPYSGSLSGVAVRTKTGSIYSGSYIENVAFNPSLPPLQSAVVALSMKGELPTDVEACLLVEFSDARITQADASQAVLRGLNRDVVLETVYAQKA